MSGYKGTPWNANDTKSPGTCYWIFMLNNGSVACILYCMRQRQQHNDVTYCWPASGYWLVDVLQIFLDPTRQFCDIVWWVISTLDLSIQLIPKVFNGVQIWGACAGQSILLLAWSTMYWLAILDRCWHALSFMNKAFSPSHDWYHFHCQYLIHVMLAIQITIDVNEFVKVDV